MVNFLKRKNEAATKVKEYLTHFQTQEKLPKAFQVNRGKEFLNKTLLSRCREQGIDVQKMAGYLPSQNGIVECMNCTLVELACAMIHGQNLPEFLWELAVEHAM